MDGILLIVKNFNDVMTAWASSYNLPPAVYSFLFPPTVDPNKIASMINVGVFPTIDGLAPAITVFLALSIGRLILQTAIIKVGVNIPVNSIDIVIT